ncbi:MAG: endo-1,4-beta-xylanase, partial [Bacteroidota bacterium]
MIRLLTAAALLGVAALLGAAGCSEAVPPEAPTLRNSTSMPVGATISLRDRFEGQPTENLRTPFYAALVAEHFNSITVENMMKLSNIAVGEGTYEWTHADEAVRFAEANDIRLHGHTLFWHYSIPGFIR